MTVAMRSLHEPANVAIIGASGGIGRALVDSLIDDTAIAKVFAFSRAVVDWNSDKIHSDTIDLADEASIQKAAKLATTQSPLDCVIVASGLLHDRPDVVPEKRMQDIDGDALLRVVSVNALGPTLVAKHFLPTLRHGHKSVFAALSARVGSIGDNRLGGWVSYRMSKAALNMMIRTLAIEQARRRPECVVVGLHPGTVDTDLSEPFARSTARRFSPAHSAQEMLKVIDGLQSESTGGFYAYDGSRIEY